MSLDILLLLALEFAGVGDDSFNGTELGDEFFRRFFADARDAGDVICGIAPEAEDVDDLLRALDFPIFQHRGQVDDFVVRAFPAGFPHAGRF